MPQRIFNHNPKWPAYAIGNRGQGAFIGMHEVNFVGDGAIGTNLGVHHVEMSRVATGLYSMLYPSAPYVGIMPGVESPSGVHYDVSIHAKNVGSGTAYLQVQGKVGTGVATPIMGMINPLSGTRVNMQFFGGPTWAY